MGITSFGARNIDFLKRVIATYRSLESFDVDVVVFSDATKDIGNQARVVVGLPSDDPWSLGVAHKQLFAENSDRYDLFAYSEDDIEVNASHLRAFLDVTPALSPNEIAGFMLYERDDDGASSLPNVHGPFHWRPESVRRRGGNTVAEFTNEHSAFYLLTRDQLKKAIASGGYLQEPYRSRYDMLCTASTDPYTSCGFRKVICISRLNDFLIRHLPNQYCGVHTVSLSEFQKQVDALMAIAQGDHPASTLCGVEPKTGPARWAKSYYEDARQDLLSAIPNQARTVLSIGCGWGETEAALIHRGVKVTALPLDSAIGASAASKGVRMIYGSLAEGLDQLDGQMFDCILMTDLLHLLEEPWKVLERCSRLLGVGGTLLLSGPNFAYLPIFVEQLTGSRLQEFDNFGKTGINPFSVAELEKHLGKFGFTVSNLTWQAANNGASVSGSSRRISWPRRVASSAWRTIGLLATRNSFSAGSPLRILADRWIVRATLATSPHPGSANGKKSPASGRIPVSAVA